MSDIFDVYRQEIKYRISLYNALRAMRYLDTIMQCDSHNGPDGYMVRSLYFDSLYNHDLEDKEDGLENRKKIRLRIYSAHDTTAKLELKEKQGQYQRKRSLSVARDAAIRLAAGDYTPLIHMQNPLAGQLYRLMNGFAYIPRCIVQYRRYAFASPTNDTRITFDSALTATEGYLDLFGGDDFLYPVGWPDDVTLEVKYNHFLLSYIKDSLDAIDKTPVSFSKYAMSRFMTHNIYPVV